MYMSLDHHSEFYFLFSRKNIHQVFKRINTKLLILIVFHNDTCKENTSSQLP